MKAIYTTLSKPGKRQKNEDSVFPCGNIKVPNLFIVCDGVGGISNGETASRIVCTTIADFFYKTIQDLEIDEENVKEAVSLASLQLSDHVKKNPADKGLSTTIALLYTSCKTAIIAHSGDSRIYHIRDGVVLFETTDHSYVNDLLSVGLITKQEAASHPKKNVLNRSISASEDNATVDITKVTDLRKNDFFFICSDGVLEGIDEKFLNDNFLSDLQAGSIDNLMEEIDALCSEKSRDNYSAIIVQLV